MLIILIVMFIIQQYVNSGTYFCTMNEKEYIRTFAPTGRESVSTKNKCVEQ